MKVLQTLNIQTNAAYPNEDACHEAVNAMLGYFQEQYPIVKFKVEAECYKSTVAGA